MADHADTGGHEQQRQMRQQALGGLKHALGQLGQDHEARQHERHADYRAGHRQGQRARRHLAGKLKGKDEGKVENHDWGFPVRGYLASIGRAGWG
jgi:2-phospho-L-lactate transferase/gluconeogenesis factor (CofD/UPF0052 family)